MSDPLPNCNQGRLQKVAESLPDLVFESHADSRFTKQQYRGNFRFQFKKRKYIMNFIKNFLREEDGVTAIEYALLAALIGVGIIGGATTLGSNISAKFTAIATKIGTTA